MRYRFKTTACAVTRRPIFLFVWIKSNCLTILFSFSFLYYNCAGNIKHFQNQLDNNNSAISPCPIDTHYPIWFFNPPPGTILGYYHDTISSARDANIRSIGYRDLRVYGTLRYYGDGRSDDFQDSVRFYYQEPDSVTLNKMACVDSFFICCSGYLQLFAPKGLTIDTSRIDPCGFSKTLPKVVCNRLIANGEYRFEYYNQALSWMHAEENAVKALCNWALHWFSALQKKNGEEISTVMMKRFDLSIKNIRIEQRRYDEQGNICNVTISCDTTDILAAPRKEHDQ
jgi:hypothetical protein